MSEVERYLDELFDRLAGQGAAGRRALAEAEDHLHAAAADTVARGLPADQAERDAVARFGSPAVVASRMRAATGGGPVSRAVSAGWLLAGLAAAGLGMADLVAAGRLGWQSPAWSCRNVLSPACYSIGGPALRATTSAAVAAAGAALLLGWWLAVRYAGLAPVRRGFVLAAGLLLGLVVFGCGMSGQAVAMPGALRSLVFDVLPGPYLTAGAAFTVGATVLIECLAAAVSLAGSHPRWYACAAAIRRS